jgi:hypothetical protein
VAKVGNVQKSQFARNDGGGTLKPLLLSAPVEP